MPVSICPNCTQRFTYDPLTIDYVHTCYGSEARSNEDIPRLGEFGWNWQGHADKRGGRTIAVEGYPKVYTYTKRGFRAATHETRQHEQFIELNGGYL